MPERGYRPGELLRIRHERWRVIRATVYESHVAIEVCGSDHTNAGTPAVFLAPSERVERLAISRSPRVVSPARWRHIVRQQLGTAVPRPDSLRAPAAANITIMPFQLEPVLAVTQGIGCRLLVADEVGLGKTVQGGLVVAEMLQRTPGGRALIVTPAALRYQWRDELSSRFGLAPALLDAAGVARTRASMAAGANPWCGFPVIVASVDYIKQPEVVRALESLVWDVLVLDEAHALSGTSDRAVAAAGIAARARVVVGLSATPHAGDDEGFARLCNLGRLQDSSPVLLFRRTRRDIGLPSTRRTTWLRVRSTDAERAMHRALLQYARRVGAAGHGDVSGARLAMSILVKRACSSAASLARSVERRLVLLSARPDTTADDQLALPFGSPDEEPLAALAAPGLHDRATEQHLLEEILALSLKAADHERKLAVLIRLLRRCREPAIVFTEYRDTLQHLAAHLHPGRVTTMHGGLTASERRDAIREFTHGDAEVLLATDAASEGLNLHHRCRRVVNMELPWTPLRLEQRIGRVDRLGQQRRVHATHLVAIATPEEDIVARLLGRMSRADLALARTPQLDGVEAHIAAAVVGVPVLPLTTTAAVHSPAEPRFVTPDLGASARQEAERLLLVRQLAQRSTPSNTGSRPVITRIRRRTYRQCLWGLRLIFADELGQIVWSTLIGAVASPKGTATHDLRQLLDFQAAQTAPPLLEHVPALAPESAWVGMALRREREMLAWLQAGCARIAPREPGLFDRRAERTAVAQQLILAEAMDRCERHLAHLARWHTATLADPEPLFAALFE